MPDELPALPTTVVDAIRKSLPALQADEFLEMLKTAKEDRKKVEDLAETNAELLRKFAEADKEIVELRRKVEILTGREPDLDRREKDLDDVPGMVSEHQETTEVQGEGEPPQ